MSSQSQSQSNQTSREQRDAEKFARLIQNHNKAILKIQDPTLRAAFQDTFKLIILLTKQMTTKIEELKDEVRELRDTVEGASVMTNLGKRQRTQLTF